MLKKLDYPSHVTRGSMAAVNMWWFNAGVAPVYRSYTLALAIGDTVITSTLMSGDGCREMPSYENTIAVPRELAPGRYPVRVGLLDPATRRPAIQLAIAGRQTDGWYQVGEIVVD